MDDEDEASVEFVKQAVAVADDTPGATSTKSFTVGAAIVEATVSCEGWRDGSSIQTTVVFELSDECAAYVAADDDKLPRVTIETSDSGAPDALAAALEYAAGVIRKQMIRSLK